MTPVEEKKIAQASKELVERARLGDQVAIGILTKTRENAAKGNPRAQVALGFMMSAVKSTPPKSRVGGFFSSALGTLRDKIRRVGNPKEYAAHVVAHVPEVGSSVRDATNAAQAISRGPAIGKDIIGEIHAAFGAENEKKAFWFGARAPASKLVQVCKNCSDKERRAIQVGYSVGLARRLQAARGGNIAALSPRAAWELS